MHTNPVITTMNNVTVPVECSLSGDLENGIAECPEGLSGECACAYTCNEGYIPTEQHCLRCDTDRSSIPVPTCNSESPIEIKCDPLGLKYIIELQ